MWLRSLSMFGISLPSFQCFGSVSTMIGEKIGKALDAATAVASDLLAGADPQHVIRDHVLAAGSARLQVGGVERELGNSGRRRRSSSSVVSPKRRLA